MNDPRVYMDGVEFDSVTVVTASSPSNSIVEFSQSDCEARLSAAETEIKTLRRQLAEAQDEVESHQIPTVQEIMQHEMDRIRKALHVEHGRAEAAEARCRELEAENEELRTLPAIFAAQQRSRELEAERDQLAQAKINAETNARLLTTSEKMLRGAMIFGVTAIVEWFEWHDMPARSSFSHPATYGFAIAALTMVVLAFCFRQTGINCK